MDHLAHAVWIVLIISTNGNQDKSRARPSFHDVIPPDQSEVTTPYAFNEMDHRSAILCPEGFFISEMTYFFEEHPEGKPTTVHGTKTTLHVKYLAHTQETKANEYSFRTMSYGPCSTLLHCLGHQACLFSLSIELCKFDPSPGFRKFLYLNATCSRNELVEELLGVQDKGDNCVAAGVNPAPNGEQMWTVNDNGGEDKDAIVDVNMEACDNAPKPTSRYDGVSNQKLTRHVIVIKATNVHHEDDVSSGTTTNNQPHLEKVKIGTSIVSNDVVFGLTCPAFDQIQEKGYRGSCLTDPPDASTVVEDTWKLLARASDQDCRDQLLQVYCSYKYDSFGNCRPPFAVQPEARKDWSFISQPTPGVWADSTKLDSISSSPYMDLIPARLAFLFIVHKSPTAVLDMLKAMYRPQHFYVIHVDISRTDVSQELIQLIRDWFNGADNIHVLDRDQSFRSSWGGYGLTRSVSEGGEKLLEMGVWDFMLDISGSDLPLRDVDDLAMMLAPYRGLSYFLTNGKSVNVKNDKALQTTWHACGGHLFNVTNRKQRSENIYMGSNWAIHSRRLVEFMVNPRVEASIELGLMYYMQTSMVSDETYYPTMFLNTPLRKDIRFRGFTFMKPFIGEDSNNLCRHREETDSCGRGPGVFQPADIGHVLLQTHQHFFGRKFSTDSSNWLRQQILTSVTSKAYKREQINMIPQLFINGTARLAMDYITSHHGEGYKLKAITDLSITPRLHSDDACCQMALDNSVFVVQEYVYWLEILMSHTDGQQKKARAMVIPRQPLFHTCYGGGHIRAIQLTTRSEKSEEPQAPQSQRPPSKANTPMPYDWTEARTMWLHLAIHTADNIPSACSDKDDQNGDFVQWPPLDPSKFPPLHPGQRSPPPNVTNRLPKRTLRLILHSPDGTTVTKVVNITEPYPSGDRKQPDIQVMTQPLEFGPFIPGWWKVTVTQIGVTGGFVYEQSILLLPRDNPPITDTYAQYIGDEFVSKYYTVKAAALLDDLDPREYYPDIQYNLEEELRKTESIYTTYGAKESQKNTSPPRPPPDRRSYRSYPEQPRSRGPKPRPETPPPRSQYNTVNHHNNRILPITCIIVASVILAAIFFGDVIYRSNKKGSTGKVLSCIGWSYVSLVLLVIIVLALMYYLSITHINNSPASGVVHHML